MDFFVALLLGGVLVALFLVLRTLQNMASGLGRRDADAGSLSEAASAIRDRLADVQAMLRNRQEVESKTAQSIRNVEMLIAGTQSKGAAGENIIDAVFAQLPPEWQIRNFRVGNKIVEFGLRLPNKKILPIDSKWPATNLVEQFHRSEDEAERRRLKADIDRAVLNKAKEVRKYVDPDLTFGFGIAVIPDSVFHLCSAAQCETFQMRVVLLSYSMFVPYLLLVFETVLRTPTDIDRETLSDHLREVASNVSRIEQEVNGRFSNAITLLTNSKNSMSQDLSRISSRLSALQMQTGEKHDQLQPPAPLAFGIDDEINGLTEQKAGHLSPG